MTQSNEEFSNAERFARLDEGLADLIRQGGGSEKEVHVARDLLGFLYSIAMSLERIGGALEGSILRDAMERRAGEKRE